MEHEIEARWPPSCRTSLVGSGPRALLQDHMNAGGSDVPIFLRRWAVRVPAVLWEPVGWDSSLVP